MMYSLLRRLGLLPGLLLLLALVAARPAQATHLLGGEMTYRYLDANGPTAAPHRYEITLNVYLNKNANITATIDNVTIGIYQTSGAQVVLTSTNYAGTVTSGQAPNNGRIYISTYTLASYPSVPVPVGCNITGGTQQPYEVRKFTAIVNLPATTNGYFAFWSNSARNNAIANLSSPGTAYLTLYTTLAPPVYTNHSPVFANQAIAVICVNDTTVLLNNAADADGDQLIYSFGTPYNVTSQTPATFAPPPATVTYLNSSYSATTPLGASPNYAYINPATGIAKYFATSVGSQYAVAIDVKEYRNVNGSPVLIGTTRRDVQLIVGTCPPTPAPVLPTTSGGGSVQSNYTIEAGSTLSIPITVTQADHHDLDLTVSSVLLDGPGGYNATFAGNPGTTTLSNPIGSVLISGTGGTVSGTFVYNSACSEARATPYDITLLVQDKGCGGKTAADVIHITVVKPTGVSAIAGDANVCGLNTTHTYTATVGTAPSVSWRLSGGGTFTSANPGNPVNVLWTTAGTYTLTARGLSQYGCLTDSVQKTVVVSPAAVLAVIGNQNICQGNSTTLTITGAAPYTITDGNTTLSGAGPFTLSPTQTTTYTISGTPTGIGCTPTTQVTVVVRPLPAAATGPAVSTCSGVPVGIGAAPVAGSTYSWTPTTGLSSATVANPIVTLTNTTGAPISQTYTLTETGANACPNTNSVTVTVNPLPTAVPGANVAFCSGNSAQLGAAPVAGLTYSWSPATGLSDPTIANPTVTLTNTTGAPITTTYTLTVTNATTACASTGTVAVTVNPNPVAVPGAAVTYCSGGSAVLGAAPVAGLTYSWSPATGLSSATVANPTVTLTNTTGAPVTTTYTLTVTNATTACTSTGTVAVTVNPNPVAVPGAAVTLCSGSSAQLGAAPVAGLNYSWSPGTGLSSTSVANPTFTLTNTTGANITTTYTLTVTNATTACVSTGTVVVTVRPAPPITPGANVVICSTETAQLGAAPVAGFTYSWSPVTGLSSPTIANPTVTLANTTPTPYTTTYTLTVTNPATGCTSTGTVQVLVNPVPTPVPGNNLTLCSGVTGQLGGAPLPGYTYVWSPTTGLNNPNIANPTVTLLNTTGAPYSITYTLRLTSAPITCTNTGTVTVTVNPLPTVVPGAAVAICSGNTAQLGAAPVAGLTYSWSPAAGLSDPNIANPTVTLTNTTGAAVIQTYTLTVTNTANSCTNTGTVAVTVNFNPVAVPGAAVAFCSGGSVQLGGAPVAGYSYSWSPATGLSSATAANPTVTLTNTTGAPVTSTYTLTVINTATGCTSTGTVAVTVNPIPVAVPGSNVTICSGNSAQLGAAPVAGLTYSWSPATGLSNPTSANPTVTLTNTTGAATTTTYTLTVTNPATSCASTGTVQVLVNPNPPVTPGANVVICSTETEQLGAAPVAGLTYSWSPATGLSNPTIANPTVTLANTTPNPYTITYTLTAINPVTGCISTGTVQVLVNPVPTPVPGNNLTLCSGLAGQLGGAPLPGYTYVWSPTTGLNNPNIANPTVTLTNTTGAPYSITYTLRLTSAPITCTNTGTVTVTVIPLPDVAPGAPVAICSGGTAQLGAAPVAGLTYSWSPATGLSDPTIANPTVTLTNTTGTPATSTYTLTVTNPATTCVNTGTVAVLVNPLPTVVPGANIGICSGATGQLGDAPVAGYTYSWSPATGLSSATAANPTVTLTTATGVVTTQTYTLTVTNTATSCVNMGTVVVTVNPIPVALPGAATTVCSGVAGQLGDAPVAGYTYSWSPATGLSSATAANPTVTLTTATGVVTTQTYTLTVTSAAGCSSTGSVVVTVNPLPVAVPGATITICSGNAGQLGATPVAGLTYSWSPTTGLSSATAANPTVTLTNATSAAVTQTYTLTVTNTATGCSNTGTVAVNVNPAIRPGTIGTDQPVCPLFVPNPLTELVPASAGVGGYTYQWERSLDNITWSAIPGATATTYAPGLLTLTTYYRRRVSSGDCASAVSNVVTLTIQPVLLTGVTLPTPAAQCAGTPMTFTAVPTNAGPAPTYRWFVNGTLTAVTTPTFTSSTLADGDQVTVEVTTTPGFCATGPGTAVAIAHHIPVYLPTVTIKATTDPHVCEGTAISFGVDNATNAGATPQFQWLVDGKPVAGATAATFTAVLKNGQVVTLTLTATTTPCGPRSVTSTGVAVQVDPPVHVNAGPNQDLMEGDQTYLEGTADGTYPVLWTPALGLSSTTVLQPAVSPPVGTHVYTLTGTRGQCSDQSQVTVVVHAGLRIASAFSPNGDGVDDTWQIANIAEYPGNRVTVFNRWGNKLFQTDNYGPGNEWSGTVNGQPAPVGTYYFVITAKGHSFTGPLTIIY